MLVQYNRYFAQNSNRCNIRVLNIVQKFRWTKPQSPTKISNIKWNRNLYIIN